MEHFDIKEIKRKVKSVIEYSQGIYNPQVDELIENWYEAKKEFIDLFDGELIYTLPEKVTFTLSDEIKNTKIIDFIDWVRFSVHMPNLADYIELNKEGFYSNMVINPCVEKGIPTGMKLLKSFKFFVEDKDMLYMIQDKASMIIQENKVEGYLHISVHPLDYLSSSENNHNWRSCHALDGEFRAGNLSYMTDEVTLICYMTDDLELERLSAFGDVKWNSKKWRMLLYASPNRELFFAGRQYPFFTATALDYVKKYFVEKIFKKTYNFSPYTSYIFSDWTDITVVSYTMSNGEVIEFSPYQDNLFIQNSIVDKSEIIEDVVDLHYNDVLKSTCYKPYYSYYVNRLKANNSGLKMKVGSEVKCLCCGNNYLCESEWMTCGSCSDYDCYYCECCGTRLRASIDEYAFLSNGLVVCADCYNEQCGYCQHCREDMFLNQMHWDEETEEYYCKSCYNRLIQNRE